MNHDSLRKRKYRKPIYSFIITIIIALLSFLPYIHDFDFFEGKKGFSGFSSLRVAIFFISIFIIAISGWLFAFINSKGKSYRFAIIAPIVMLTYQLFIYVLDKRDSVVNDFNLKVVFNFLLYLIIIITYFLFKGKGENSK